MGQMLGVSEELQKEAEFVNAKLEQAQTLWQQLIDRSSYYAQIYGEWSNKFIFNCPEPVGDLSQIETIPVYRAAHNVFATDGSQIAPSRHEIAYCYLINIGRIGLYYGTNHHPLLDSVPQIFYKREDLNLARQWGIPLEQWMGLQRTASETEALGMLATGVSSPHPSLALTDGGLIHWELETIANEPRTILLQRIFAAWEQLRLAGIPLVGYISSPRSTETNHFLRLAACPFPEPDCQTHCREKTISERHNSAKLVDISSTPLKIDSEPSQNIENTANPSSTKPSSKKLENLPCSQAYPLRDLRLWEKLFRGNSLNQNFSSDDLGKNLESNLESNSGNNLNLFGKVSPLWHSHSSILREYAPEHQIYICYLHVGSEIVRIEMPAWTALNRELRHQALGMILAQVQKGLGYPVALAEAHNQAVVTGSDRQRFFSALEQSMVKAGLPRVGISYKESRKRNSIA
jgi:hypothetical protein